MMLIRRLISSASLSDTSASYWMLTGRRCCSGSCSGGDVDRGGRKRWLDLFERLAAGERSALAESITLIESVHPEKKKESLTLLHHILKHRIKQEKDQDLTFRIGLSGPPGAGKSTFIEAFGKHLTERSHKVAVLTVDPSSCTSGGSLLADKTRMPQLTVDPNAFIRPSPSSGSLGGVTRTTNNAILLCEMAGFNIILVETVGVGQSEFAVADMVDMFILLIPPAGGDELQGIKKGIVEAADLVIVNKSDGDLEAAARRIQAEYISAMKFVHSRRKFWQPKVLRVSSRTLAGIPDMWDVVSEFRLKMSYSGELSRVRMEQRVLAMWSHVQERLLDEFRQDADVMRLVNQMEDLVRSGSVTSGFATEQLMQKFLKSSSED